MQKCLKWAIDNAILTPEQRESSPRSRCQGTMMMNKTLPLRPITTILGSLLIWLLSAVSEQLGQPVKIIVNTDMLTDPRTSTPCGC